MALRSTNCAEKGCVSSSLFCMKSLCGGVCVATAPPIGMAATKQDLGDLRFQREMLLREMLLGSLCKCIKT